MLAKYLELNFEGCITFQEKKTKAVVLRSRPQQNVKNAFSRRSRAVTAKKCTTKKSVIHVQSCCFVSLRPCLHGVGDPGLVG